MSALEHIVKFTPAYDERPKYGVHGVELRMIVKGPRGAVQFVLMTNWHLPHVQHEYAQQYLGRYQLSPTPADFGYHSPVPRYQDQVETDGCPWVASGTCYYDGSGLRAGKVYERLLREGDAGVWAELEAEYHQLFGDA